MPAIYTPLRYPGGKAKMGHFIAEVLRANRLLDAVYAEPYAGGAGAGLFLLFRGYAERIQLNDINPHVVAFWRAVLENTERFARLVETVELTVTEWDRQKQIVRGGDRGFEAGFAFFYLNRTNRSGIMNAGVIGGRNQTGQWGIDARFNRSELAERVRAIGRLKRRISISSDDALTFLDRLARERNPKTFVYLDPPYYHKGRELYTNFYTEENHREIADRLQAFQQHWMLTYDDCAEIRALYMTHQVLSSELSYSARSVRRGKEVVVLGPTLRPPTVKPTKKRGFALV